MLHEYFLGWLLKNLNYKKKLIKIENFIYWPKKKERKKEEEEEKNTHIHTNT